MFEALLPFEIEVFHWIASWASPFWDVFFVTVTRLGSSGVLWIVLGLALLFPKRTRKIGLVVLGAVGVMIIVNSVALKNLFGRPRPFMVEVDWWIEAFNSPGLISYPSSLSFPSGHAASAFAGSVAFLLGARKWGDSKRMQGIAIACIGLAGLIAFSRLYLGVHYLTDIVVGALVGTGCAFLTTLAMRIVEPQIEKFKFLGPLLR